MRSRVRGALLVALAAGAAVPVLPAAARADGELSLTAVGRPSWFQLSARRGGHAGGEVRLDNLTGRTLHVRLDPIDVGVAAGGGLAYDVGAPRHVGRWLHVAARRLTLPPHAERVVPFTAHVPRSAAGGDHFAALAAAVDAPAGRGRRGLGVQVLSRLAIAVRLRVPGRRVGVLHVGRASGSARGVPALVVPLGNAGTGMLDAVDVHLAVRRGRRTVFTVRRRLGEFVPHAILDLWTRWAGPVRVGHYRLDGWVRAGGRTVRVHQRFALRR